MNSRLGSVALTLRRTYASQATRFRYPRPKPGTSERPPARPADPLATSPAAAATELDDEPLTFIHRPPPAAASPVSYTTLPASPLLRARPAADGPRASGALPPVFRRADRRPTDPVAPHAVLRMRELRNRDPARYTRGVLARMFGTTEAFVGMVAALRSKSARKARVRERDALHAQSRAQWSERREMIVAIRQKRRTFW
ncbi:mitochondrial ribosomal protein subunit L20-domain-containing protein [Schizophyllum fasciatum]